jgi:hypothetical protein
VPREASVAQGDGSTRSSPPRRPAARWTRRGALLAQGIALALLAVRAYGRSGNDFRVFRTAGVRFWSGASLYPASDGFYAYRYAPGAAALFVPLGWAAEPVAKALWLSTICLLAIATTAMLHRQTRARAWFAAPLALAALADPLYLELRHGQANLLVLALVLAAFALEDRGREGAAGALLAVAIALKIAPALVAVDWLLRRRWRALAGVGAGLGAIACAPLASHGLEGTVALHVDWVRAQLASSGEVLHLARNQSVWGIAARAGAATVAAALAVLAVLGAAFSEPRREVRRALVLLAVPLASPFGWLQNFVFALPLTALLLAGPPRVRWPALALSAGTILLGYDFIGAIGQQWALEHSLFGGFMVALFALGRAAGGSPYAAAASKPAA